jgi:hypothetical protein
MKKLLTFAFFDLSMRIRIILEYPTMKKLLTFAFLLCTISALQAQTLADTTKITVFDRTNQWIATGAELKAYCASGGGGSVATDAIWDAAGDLVVGTGANTAARLAMGTANQQLRVNSGGTALEYFTPSAGSGDITNGGNTTGAAVTIGTNDANGLNLETNNVTRVAITGAASTGGAVTISNTTANTSTVQNVLTIQSNSTGTAAAGLGVGVLFQQESSTANNRDAGRITTPWTTATDGSQTADMIMYTSAGGALQENGRFRGNTADLLIGAASQAAYKANGITTAQSYTVGNSASALTLGGNSGTITISTSNTASFGPTILVNSTGEFTNGGIGIQLGNASYTGTSLNKTSVYIADGYAAASGAGTMNSLFIGGTFNQTSTASGTIKGLVVNPTLTSIKGAYRAIEIGANNSLAKGIYQTGSSTTNNFVGKTSFGATTAPTSLVTLAAGTASANTAPLKFTSGTNLTTPENGAVEYDGTNYYATSGGVRYTLAKVLTGSSILDFGATGPGAASNLTVTVTGAAAGDVVSVGVDYSTVAVANGSFTGYVSAADTVTIRYTNNDLTTEYNPASATFKVTVTKF